jgi:hypothetical protein
MKIKTDLINSKTRSQINNSKVLLKAYKLIFYTLFFTDFNEYNKDRR